MINASAEIKKIQYQAINIYQLDDITNEWAKFDVRGSGFISYKDFWTFSSRIAQILGVKTSDFLDPKAKIKFFKLLDLPVYEYEGYKKIFCFSFYDVVLTLTRIAVIVKMNIKKFIYFYFFYLKQK